MSVDAKIVTALKPLGYDVVKNVYQGEAKEYIAFNYDTVPYYFADDYPETERYIIQVHLFADPSIKILEDVGKIKKLLAKADFIYPETIDASDNDWQHIVFETEYLEGVDNGGN